MLWHKSLYHEVLREEDLFNISDDALNEKVIYCSESCSNCLNKPEDKNFLHARLASLVLKL